MSEEAPQPAPRRSPWSELITPALVVAVPVLYVLGLAYEGGFLYSLGYGNLGFDGMIQLPISWQDYTKSAAMVLAGVVSGAVLLVLGVIALASLCGLAVLPPLIVWRRRRVRVSLDRIWRTAKAALPRFRLPKLLSRPFPTLLTVSLPLTPRQRVLARHVWILFLGVSVCAVSLLLASAGSEFISWPLSGKYVGIYFAGLFAYVLEKIMALSIAVLSCALLLAFFFGKKGAVSDEWKRLNEGPVLGSLLTVPGGLAILFVALAPTLFNFGVLTGEHLMSAANRPTHRISWKQGDRLEQADVVVLRTYEKVSLYVLPDGQLLMLRSDDVASMQAIRVPQFGASFVQYWPFCERFHITAGFCYRTVLADK